MRLNMKGITEMVTTAAKMCRASYDTGVTWEKIAIDSCTRYLMEEQRAELYASANAALYDKLTAKTLEHNTTVLDLATKLQNETIRAEQLEDKLQISNDNLAQLQKKADAIGIGKPAFPQDQLRPGDPRRDFPGGVPYTINSRDAGKVTLDSKQTASAVVVVWSTPWRFSLSTGRAGEWDIFDRFNNRVGYVASEELAQFIVNCANAGALKPPSVPRIGLSLPPAYDAHDRLRPTTTGYNPARVPEEKCPEPAPGRIAD